MTGTAGGGFVRFPGPRQPAPPNPDPASRSANHRLDPIGQIDDNDGNTPDQQTPRCLWLTSPVSGLALSGKRVAHVAGSWTELNLFLALIADHAT